jgi:hypothetical protein
MRINFSNADFSNGPNAGAHHDNIMKAILHALPVVLGEKFRRGPSHRREYRLSLFHGDQ